MSIIDGEQQRRRRDKQQQKPQRRALCVKQLEQSGKERHVKQAHQDREDVLYLEPCHRRERQKELTAQASAHESAAIVEQPVAHLPGFLPVGDQKQERDCPDEHAHEKHSGEGVADE